MGVNAMPRLRALRKYSTVKRWPRTHYNPHRNLLVSFRRRTRELEFGAGTNDDEYLWRDGHFVYVLSVNTRMPYVGLAVYDLHGEPTKVDQGLSQDLEAYSAITPASEVFLQVDHEQEDILGRDWTRLAPATLLRRLMPYVEG
jgi:hypothetical protein